MVELARALFGVAAVIVALKVFQVAFWPLVIVLWVAGSVWLTARVIDGAYRRQDERERWQHELVGRCEREHRLFMQGDPEGVHGRYPPVHVGYPAGT